MRLFNLHQGVVRLNKILQIIKAEMIKQHRIAFHSKLIYFSLLIWPMFYFFNAYYNYKPFNITKSNWVGINSNNDLLIFLVIGLLGYITFWSMVQSSWQMSMERQNGTLEIIFLSPANRLAMMYGRAAGALIENIWMFVVFSLLLIFWIQGIPFINLIKLPIVFVVLIISAIIWGGLLNVIFLFSRDASILFTVLDEPMVLFSGVRFPTSLFPIWAKFISVIFPLTHVLLIIRYLLEENYSIQMLTSSISSLLITLGLIIFLTIWLLNKAEKNSRKTGNFNFY